MATKKKRITFLTGTRADFGKLLPLIRQTRVSRGFQIEVVATGMHLLADYGYTINEIQKAGIREIFPIFNQDSSTSEKMDIVLANTTTQLSHYLNERRPDLLVIHGDRVEALAGAITGALNNVRIAHIEGGEVSGTIDESIRHAISKMVHLHLVANEQAKQRLIQMGESEHAIHIIGSPEVDVMLGDELPTLEEAKRRYGIKFDDFAVLVYHPVTTERDQHEDNVAQVIAAVERSGHNFIAIRANNDIGSGVINARLNVLNKLPRFRVFPSLRFEYYLTFLRNARYIIGNSSSGVREAPVYGVPCINVGSRQFNRNSSTAIHNVSENTAEILAAIAALPARHEPLATFGDGKAAERFRDLILSERFWATPTQKTFFDRPVTTRPEST